MCRFFIHTLNYNKYSLTSQNIPEAMSTAEIAGIRSHLNLSLGKIRCLVFLIWIALEIKKALTPKAAIEDEIILW